MTISSGNLDALLNVTLSLGNYSGVAEQSYTTGGTEFSPTLSSISVETTGTVGLGAAAGTGESVKIASVNDTSNAATLVFYFDGTAQAQLTTYVIGYADDALLLAGNNSKTIAILLNDGDSVDYDFGVISPTSLPAQTTITFTADGTYTAALPCFARGTRITTQRGEIPVEQLSTDDLVLARAAGFTPARWIGSRRADCRRHPSPANVWPVRVRAHAFGAAQPRRDLWLSPDHAIFVDDVLIPIKLLINGHSIVQTPVDEITYYHVELPRHDVLLAEGLPAESYLDTGNRRNFAGSEAPVTLHPDFVALTWESEACAPLIVSGPELDRVRSRLNAATTARDQAAAA